MWTVLPLRKPRVLACETRGTTQTTNQSRMIIIGLRFHFSPCWSLTLRLVPPLTGTSKLHMSHLRQCCCKADSRARTAVSENTDTIGLQVGLHIAGSRSPSLAPITALYSASPLLNVPAPCVVLHGLKQPSVHFQNAPCPIRVDHKRDAVLFTPWCPTLIFWVNLGCAFKYVTNFFNCRILLGTG